MSSKEKRYEMFKKDNKIFYYDRCNHCVVSKKGNSLGKREKYICAIYPNKLLKFIRIPQVFICFFFILSILLFCFSIINFIISFHYIKVLFVNINILYVIYIPFIVLISIFMHEVSHAITGSSLSGFVAEVGVVRKGVSVRFFTKLIWLIEKPLWKIEYYFSGIAMNMFLCGISIIIFNCYNNILLIFLFIINYVFVILNFVPISRFKSDGFNLLRLIKQH